MKIPISQSIAELSVVVVSQLSAAAGIWAIPGQGSRSLGASSARCMAESSFAAWA